LNDKRLLAENFLGQFCRLALAPLGAEHGKRHQSGLDNQLSSLPFRIGEIFPTLGRFLRAHHFGVVGNRQGEIIGADKSLVGIDRIKAKILFPSGKSGQHIAIDQRPQRA
jgi:hypothetical protein